MPRPLYKVFEAIKPFIDDETFYSGLCRAIGLARFTNKISDDEAQDAWYYVQNSIHPYCSVGDWLIGQGVNRRLVARARNLQVYRRRWVRHIIKELKNS
jgi:hypothetical protein